MKNYFKDLDPTLKQYCTDNDGNLIVERLFALKDPDLSMPSCLTLHFNTSVSKAFKFLVLKFDAVLIQSTNTINLSKTKNSLDEAYGWSNSLFMIPIKDTDYFMYVKVFYNSSGVTYIMTYYNNKRETELNHFSKLLKKLCENDDSKKISFISNNNNRWSIQDSEIKKEPIIDFDLNYNDDFDHDEVTGLIKDNANGLILLGGKPGSGKTNYLKWLASNVDRKFVYMPANQIGLMGSPSFISFALEELQDTVIVMEDCEEVLVSREEFKGSEVHTILNLSDGILGDALNVTLIGTYNTKDNIDKAIFRKGRLLYIYDFDDLSAIKATKLSEKLGHDVKFTQPTVLSDVYNTKSNNVKKKETKSVGFTIGT